MYKAIQGIIAAASLTIVSALTQFSCTNNNSQTPRSRENFDNNWYFSLNDSAALVSEPELYSEQITLPHDWSIEMPPSKENPSGNRGGYGIGGTGWYKKSFDIPSGQKKKNVILTFDGVYKDADIWVNNLHVGFHRHGYLSFNLDITDFILPNTPNTILIKVDNSNLPHDRWYSGCGIYRHVWINYVSDVHIPVWGNYITTPEISREKASINIRTNIVNKSELPGNARIETSITDKNGQELASTIRSDLSLEDTTEIQQSLTLEDPILWNLDEPHMYTAVQKIYLNDRLVDVKETPFGIRSISFSSERGFLLNGKNIFLNGVNIHHDAGSEGAAVSDHTWYLRLLTLKEMGVNALRLSHNPHSPALLNICDTMGILVIAEAFDKWGSRPSFGFTKHWKEYTREFIERDRNHPSVIMWSLGNELGEANTPGGVKIMQNLASLAHVYEPSRPVTCAIQPPGHHENLELWDIAFEMDIVSLNYQSQFFARDKKNQEIIILASETLPYYTRNNFGLFKGQTNKYLDMNSYPAAREHAIGHFIWTGIDYLGEAVQPWPLRGWENAPISTTGYKKPFFYFMQSLYTDDPMVHIAVRDKKNNRQYGKYGWDWPPVASHWNWEGSGAPLEVFLYSNCDSVELILNGNSLGVKAERDPERLYFSYKVPYEPGEIIARGIKAGEEYLHRLQTAEKASTIRLTASRSLISGRSNETCHILAEILDENGIIVPLENHLINFSVEGAGEIIGVDNGDLWSLESYKTNFRETRDGHCLAIVRSTGEGPLKITAVSEGLMGDAVLIEIK